MLFIYHIISHMLFISHIYHMLFICLMLSLTCYLPLSSYLSYLSHIIYPSYISHCCLKSVCLNHMKCRDVKGKGSWSIAVEKFISLNISKQENYKQPRAGNSQTHQYRPEPPMVTHMACE